MKKTSAAITALVAAGIAVAGPGAGSANAQALHCTQINQFSGSLLCIRLDTEPAAHHVTVWFDKRGIGTDRVQLGYYGPTAGPIWDQGAFDIHQGEVKGYTWHWGTAAPSGCYQPVMLEDGSMTVAETVCI